MRIVYVSALQEMGGAWLSSGRYFSKRSHAEAVAEDASTSGTKKFALEEYVAVRVTGWKAGTEKDFTVLQIPAYHAQNEEAISEYVSQYWPEAEGWESIP